MTEHQQRELTRQGHVGHKLPVLPTGGERTGIWSVFWAFGRFGGNARVLTLSVLLLATVSLGGCTALNHGATLNRYKGQVLRADSRAGQERLKLEAGYDSTVRHWVDQNGAPDYLLVESAKSLLMIYVDDDRVVHFRRGWTTMSEVSLEDGVPDELTRFYTGEHRKQRPKAGGRSGASPNSRVARGQPGRARQQATAKKVEPTRQAARAGPIAQRVNHPAEMDRCKREIGKLEPAMARLTWGGLREIEIGGGQKRRIRQGRILAPVYGEIVVKEFTCTFDDDGWTQFWVD